MGKYHLMALFTVLVWGVTFVSTKVLLECFTPLQILAIRFVIGFAALCAMRPHILKVKDARHEALFAIAGASGIAAYYLLENIALVYTTATAVGVIVAASPFFTALLAALRGDRAGLNARFAFGFVMAMAGLVLVSVGGGGDLAGGFASGEALFGDALSLLAAVVWAVYSTTLTRINDLGYETIAVTKRTFLWGLVFIVPATLLFGGSLPEWGTALSGVNVANLLFLGIVACAVCFATWGAAVKHLGAVSSAVYIYLIPAITATASIVILGEPVTYPIVIGIALAIAGLAISQSKRARSTSECQEEHRSMA